MLDLRPMTQDNYLDAAMIEQTCFDDRPWTAEQFADELDLDFSRTYIVYSDGEAAGFVNMWLTPPMAVINNIAVLPRFRRQGIGRVLIYAALSAAEGCSSLTLEVRESNEPAINMYKNLDFNQVGRREGFYENPREAALIMTRFIRKGEFV